MTGERAQPAARALLVGDDAEVASALHLHLPRAGWAPFSVPSPEFLEPLLPAIAPQAIVLILPASPPSSWGAALTTAATAARTGTRVIVVAPSREVVEPLASVAGAERALSRADVLARPLCVLESGHGPRLPPPLPAASHAATAALPRGTSSTAHGTSTAAGRSTLTPLTLTPTTPAPPPDAGAGARQARRLPTVDLMALIDEELVDEPKPRPAPTRVDVNVSLVSEHNFFVGVTKRFDSGGVFISTMLPPPVGTLLEVRLGLPDARKVHVQGEVVFVRDRSAVTGRQPSGCGVKLAGLPSWAIDSIERFLAARPPILYAP